jgi:hypothetical protein
MLHYRSILFMAISPGFEYNKRMIIKCATVTIVSAMLFLSGCAGTGMIKPIDTVREDPEEQAIEDMPRAKKFHTRKRLTYAIAWNRIPVGSITAESGDIISYRGRDVYVLKLVTESNKFLSKIYRVEDTYTSYVDTVTMTSMRYEADRHEGSYTKHVIVEYDFEKMEATYYSLTDGSVKTCSIEKNVQDPVSAVCYFMTLPVKPGDMVEVTVNLNEKNYKLYSKIGEVEAIKLPRLGIWAGFKVSPYVELAGKEVRKGKAWIYAGADQNRYPLFGVVLIPFGRVTATLVSVEDI